MAILAQKIPMLPSPAIASYDYTDIAEGTGIIGYYGAETNVSGSAAFILTSDSSICSDEEGVSINITKNTTTYAKYIDNDYDLSFNLPKTIKGTAYIMVTWTMTDQGLAPTQNGYLRFIFKHYDTEIVAVQTEVKGDAGTFGTKTSLLKATIPETHFKKSDILRITVEGWGYDTQTVGNAQNLGYSQDPANRNGTATNPNTLRFLIPFKLNL